MTAHDEAARVGLCVTCRHSTRIVNARGSTFYLCELSRVDPSFPRYPPLPVIACRGWSPPAPAAPHEPEQS
jgi:hypothetical protein